MNIEVRIKPNNRKGPLILPNSTGELLVFVRQPAIDGKANAAAIKLLANYYNVAKSRISIIRGQTSRIKIISVSIDD